MDTSLRLNRFCRPVNVLRESLWKKNKKNDFFKFEIYYTFFQITVSVTEKIYFAINDAFFKMIFAIFLFWISILWCIISIFFCIFILTIYIILFIYIVCVYTESCRFNYQMFTTLCVSVCQTMDLPNGNHGLP